MKIQVMSSNTRTISPLIVSDILPQFAVKEFSFLQVKVHRISLQNLSYSREVVEWSWDFLFCKVKKIQVIVFIILLTLSLQSITHFKFVLFITSDFVLDCKPWNKCHVYHCQNLYLSEVCTVYDDNCGLRGLPLTAIFNIYYSGKKLN